MAITLSEKFRADLGGRKWRFFQMTHDESTVAISAVSLDLTYIDYFDYNVTYIASAAADLSTFESLMNASIDATHANINFAAAGVAGSKGAIMVIGW